LHVAITDLVRIPPSSVDPTVKNYHWLDLVKGLYAAYANDAETAILLDANGNVAEGPGFNVFAVKNNKISSPKFGVLMGITRQTIFDLSEEMQIACTTDDLAPSELKAADEVFVTSTAGGVMPVTKIDQTSIGTGSPGPITKELTEAYWQMHENERYRNVIHYP